MKIILFDKIDNAIYNNNIINSMTDYTKYGTIPDRCMAQIVTVDEIVPIENADNIELAKVLGWQCVVKKQEFKVGDMAIYVCIDSVLDQTNPNFAFLEGKRLKTKKLRGEISQGLLGQLSWLDGILDSTNIKIGDDVTSALNIMKYVVPEEGHQYSNHQGKKSTFPSFVPKTDEERIQNIPKIFDKIKDNQIVITRKEDGTSTTYVYKKTGETNGDFFPCSRNFKLSREDHESKKILPFYFQMVDDFDIENGMRKLGLNIAIQGEIVGPGVNGNRLKLGKYDYRVFNIWDIDAQKYLDWDQVIAITDTLNLHRVPVLYRGPLIEEYANVKNLLKFAEEQMYGKNIPAEGIVIKTDGANVRYSFKVISNKYLLKNDT